MSRVRFSEERSGIKKSRFTDEQIVGLLKQVEAGVAVRELGRKHGFSDVSSYEWQSRFGGMNVTDVRRLRELERENGKLKKLLADAVLDIEALKVVARGKR
jgi:putative transposase